MLEEYRSRCCKAELIASGMPDFMGDKGICTVHYTCSKCGAPCNVVKVKKARKRKSRKK